MKKSRITLYDHAGFVAAKSAGAGLEAGMMAGSTLMVPKVVTREGGDNGNLVVDFAISSEAVDRMKDTISLKGWRRKNFRANPVVPFGHNTRDLPIGQSLKEWVQGKLLMGRTKFTSRDEYEFGYTVGRLVESRVLRATSVGFMPIKWAFVEGDEERAGGIDFKEQELLEYSVVPVPANPEALIQASQSGIDVGLLKNWAARVLDEGFSDDNALVARAYESAWTAYSGGAKAQVEVDIDLAELERAADEESGEAADGAEQSESVQEASEGPLSGPQRSSEAVAVVRRGDGTTLTVGGQQYSFDGNFNFQRTSDGAVVIKVSSSGSDGEAATASGGNQEEAEYEGFELDVDDESDDGDDDVIEIV